MCKEYRVVSNKTSFECQICYDKISYNDTFYLCKHPCNKLYHSECFYKSLKLDVLKCCYCQRELEKNVDDDIFKWENRYGTQIKILKHFFPSLTILYAREPKLQNMYNHIEPSVPRGKQMIRKTNQKKREFYKQPIYKQTIYKKCN